MLFTQGNELVRIQCAFVDTPEIEVLTDFIGSQKASWCHFGRVCVQCVPGMCKNPSPWPPNQSYVSRQSYETPRHTIWPCLGMIWVPNTLNLPHWDKLTRYTLGWVGGQCECQCLNLPAPRPHTQSYTSHQSFGTPLKPIGHCFSTNLGQNWLKSSPRGLLCQREIPICLED